MKNIRVFDPALCCSTGVCGVDVDQTLVSFSADVDWAKQQGVQIERFNLAQQPMAFAENTVVRELLEHSGEKALPVILADGEIALTGRYPSREELAGWAGIAEQPSIFTEQVAKLVAIGAAIAANCEPCFKFHYDKARDLGVSEADMLRAVELAQKVKESPARSVLELARRYLDKSAVGSTDAAATEGSAKPNVACCAPAKDDSAKPASKCC